MSYSTTPLYTPLLGTDVQPAKYTHKGTAKHVTLSHYPACSYYDARGVGGTTEQT